MKRMTLPTTAQECDRAFAVMVVVAALAAAVGVWFGGPLDNLIVAGWLLPMWLIARRSASAERRCA